jgi:hypothetical protein
MKWLLIIFLGITSFTFFSYSFPNKIDNCKDVHSGEFYFYPKLSNSKYKIIRDGRTQKEITLSSGDTAVYKIHWIDDCTYYLEHISGGVKMPDGMRRFTTYIQFLQITKDYYLLKACMDSINSKYCLKDTMWYKPK